MVTMSRYEVLCILHLSLVLLRCRDGHGTCNEHRVARGRDHEGAPLHGAGTEGREDLADGAVGVWQVDGVSRPRADDWNPSRRAAGDDESRATRWSRVHRGVSVVARWGSCSRELRRVCRVGIGVRVRVESKLTTLRHVGAQCPDVTLCSRSIFRLPGKHITAGVRSDNPSKYVQRIGETARRDFNVV